MAKLCVNLDHIATLREARKTYEPDPVCAVPIAEMSGSDGITIHLREDKRHIQDRDLRLMREIVKTKLNLEMAAVNEMIEIAIKTKPQQCTLVPEKREEVTTEGGLSVAGNFKHIKDSVLALQKENIVVSLFVDPASNEILASKESGAEFIEINTAAYSEATNEKDVICEFEKIVKAVELATGKGLRVNAGHGLNYHNISLVAGILEIEEFNIGHSIISRSVFSGLSEAIREMKALIEFG